MSGEMGGLLYSLSNKNCIDMPFLRGVIEVSKREYGNDIIDYSDGNGYTALMYACKKGCFEAVEFLLKEGADVNKQNEAYMNALKVSAQVLQNRLSGSYRNVYNVDGYVKEHYPNIAKIVDILIKYGAEVLNSQMIMCGKIGMGNSTQSCNYIKGAYLLEQVESGNLEKLQQCIGKGLDVNFRYSSEMTALMYACKKGNFESAITLISAGVDINAKDKDGKTVLNYAAEGGNTEIMKLLLAQGADSGVKK